MSKLFSPIFVKSVELKNRIAVSPMCQYSATDGIATDWHLVHYGSRAVGGVSLVIQEATAVSPEGRITPSDLGLYNDHQIEKLKQITSFISQQGAVPGIQLAHAGRKASCTEPWKGGKQLEKNNGGWQTVAPSAIAFNSDDALPEVLTTDSILKVVSDFQSAAIRALVAGYRLIEIHAAHGYLMHQFLSPLSNQRTDLYGGSFENRIRLLREVVAAVKKVIPESCPLFVRISATDWVEGGWNIDEAVQLVSVLKTEGVDLIDCSSGGMVPYAKIPLAPGYQVAFSEKIRKETGIMTGAVGLITDSKQAEQILQNDQADLIIMGRELLRQPYFALQAANELQDEYPWPLQYVRAK